MWYAAGSADVADGGWLRMAASVQMSWLRPAFLGCLHRFVKRSCHYQGWRADQTEAIDLCYADFWNSGAFLLDLNAIARRIDRQLPCLDCHSY